MTPFLIPFCLMLTNGPSAHTNAPALPQVGWQYLASNYGCTAIGPRLTCSVGPNHVGIQEPVFNGVRYGITKVIVPTGADICFLVLDRDIASGYAKLATNYTGITSVWLVGGGASFGQVQGDLYYWAGQESKCLRWSHSGGFITAIPQKRFAWRFDEAASADGDSGYACFSEDGRYIGPISSGSNPSQLGNWQSGGELAGLYYEWIKDYLGNEPAVPPKPKVVTGLKVSQ